MITCCNNHNTNTTDNNNNNTNTTNYCYNNVIASWYKHDNDIYHDVISIYVYIYILYR